MLHRGRAASVLLQHGTQHMFGGCSRTAFAVAGSRTAFAVAGSLTLRQTPPLKSKATSVPLDTLAPGRPGLNGTEASSG